MISRISIDIRKAGEIRDILSYASNFHPHSAQSIGSIRFAHVEDIDMGELTVTVQPIDEASNNNV